MQFQPMTLEQAVKLEQELHDTWINMSENDPFEPVVWYHYKAAEAMVKAILATERRRIVS